MERREIPIGNRVHLCGPDQYGVVELVSGGYGGECIYQIRLDGGDVIDAWARGVFDLGAHGAGRPRASFVPSGRAALWRQ